MNPLIGLLPLFLVAASTGEPVHRLDFTMKIQNLSVYEMHFLENPSNRVEVCAEVSGEILYGRVPYRLKSDEPTSTWNYIQFLATYVSGQLQTVLFDFNRDYVLDCEEELVTTENAKYPGMVFRTVKLRWQEDSGAPRSFRYRVILPKELTASGTEFYRVEVVDVPTLVWTVDGTSSLWMLLDGNANGIFDRKFQDGVLVDKDGDGNIDMNPYGDDFHSFNEPIDLPWGTYGVLAVDPEGRFIKVRLLSASEIEEARILKAGDRVPLMFCESSGGATIPLGGGKSGRHQLLFFWLSSCGSCWEDMQALNPLLAEVGESRLSAVGISLDGDRDEFETFLAVTNPAWPQCFEANALWENALARRFGIRTGSDFVLLDPSGRLVMMGNGMETLQKVLHDLFLEVSFEPERQSEASPPGMVWDEKFTQLRTLTDICPY